MQWNASIIIMKILAILLSFSGIAVQFFNRITAELHRKEKQRINRV